MGPGSRPEPPVPARGGRAVAQPMTSRAAATNGHRVLPLTSTSRAVWFAVGAPRRFSALVPETATSQHIEWSDGIDHNYMVSGVRPLQPCEVPNVADLVRSEWVEVWFVARGRLCRGGWMQHRAGRLGE